MPTHRQNALAKFIATGMREEDLTNLFDAAVYTRFFLWAWWETAPEDERAKLGNVVGPLLNRLSALADYLECDEGLPVPDSLDGLVEIIARRDDQRKAEKQPQQPVPPPPVPTWPEDTTRELDRFTQFVLARMSPAAIALMAAFVAKMQAEHADEPDPAKLKAAVDQYEKAYYDAINVALDAKDEAQIALYGSPGDMKGFENPADDATVTKESAM